MLFSELQLSVLMGESWTMGVLEMQDGDDWGESRCAESVHGRVRTDNLSSGHAAVHLETTVERYSCRRRTAGLVSHRKE